MKKKIVVVVGTLVVLAGIAVAAYAAYDVSNSSSYQGFTAGAAQNLGVDPDEGDLSSILPGETRGVDVVVSNPNSVPVRVTGVDLQFSPAGCALSSTPWSGAYPLAGGASDTWVIQVAMGDPDGSCEGATLYVSGVASGWMP